MAAKKTTPRKKVAAKKVAPVRDAVIPFGSAAELRAYLDAEALKEGHRMVERGSVVNDAVYADKTEPAAPVEDAPAPAASGTWDKKASVAGQMTSHPTTVRYSNATTHQFLLSDPEQLAAWNKLQRRLSPPASPELRLDLYEHAFCPPLSSYIILVTCSEIEYQQL